MNTLSTSLLNARSPDPAHSVRNHPTGSVRGGTILAVIGLLLLMPGIFALPPIDRDESRFAEASRRMVVGESIDDWIVPKILDRPRLNKPPLIYWLQAGSVRLFAHEEANASAPNSPSNGNIWAYRLPSVLGALLAGLMTWRLGCRMFSPPVGFTAALLLMSCMVVMVDARQARTDQVLLATVVATQWSLWEIWHHRHRRQNTNAAWIAMFWLSLGLGIMTKGPVVPALAGLTIASLCLIEWRFRWLWRLKPIMGPFLTITIVAPWIVLVGERVGWSTFLHTMWDETFGRSISAMEGHRGPPGYYLLLSPALLWPASLALVPALYRGFAVGLNGGKKSEKSPACRKSGWAGRDQELFCLVWLIPFWLMFELVATKLPHYVLPTFPAFALLASRTLYAKNTVWRPMMRSVAMKTAVGGWCVLSAGLALGVPIGLAAVGNWPTTPSNLLQLAVILCGISAGFVLLVQFLRQGEFLKSQLLAVLVAFLLHVGFMTIILPKLDSIWISPRIIETLNEIDPTGERPAVAAGYQEDSLIFLGQGRIRRIAYADLPTWIQEHPSGLLILQEHPRLQDLFPSNLPTIEGFNYSTGSEVRVMVLPCAEVDSSLLSEASES